MSNLPLLEATEREQYLFEKQPRGKKKGGFWKGLGLLCLLGVVGIGGYLAFTKTGHTITHAIGVSPSLVFKNVGSNHVNILIIGEDRNWKQGMVYDPTVKKFRPSPVIDTSSRPRSDTMIICSLDQKANKMRLISIPRDSRVRYTDFEGLRHRGKLNAVYRQNRGDQLLKQVMHDELGVRIDRVAKIKLEGFTKLIDEVGGIYINVEGGKFGNKRLRMVQEDKWGHWKVDLEPGYQTLNGEQAHGYVRYRKDNEGDPGRVRRQQQVMRALAKKMMSAGPFRLSGLIGDAQKVFRTDMPNDEMIAVTKFAHGLGDPSKITPLTPYGIYADTGDKGDVILNKPENLKLFATIFGSSFNPKHFLVRSPKTKRDDIGSRNNSNPAALAVLREAGLVGAHAIVNSDAKFQAPGLQ